LIPAMEILFRVRSRIISETEFVDVNQNLEINTRRDDASPPEKPGINHLGMETFRLTLHVIELGGINIIIQCCFKRICFNHTHIISPSVMTSVMQRKMIKQRKESLLSDSASKQDIIIKKTHATK
jgi:hypothetical protein